MDTVDKLTRSRIMGAVRSRGNLSTEWRLRPLLIRAGIRGWKVQISNLPGKPDFVFYEQRIAIFVDGCFWHGCPKCCRMPRTHQSYWQNKIAKNILRDGQYRRALRASGWKVLRFWEHDLLKDPASCVDRIRSVAGLRPTIRKAKRLRQ